MILFPAIGWKTTSGPTPFNLSGSWETGNEGWTLSTGMIRTAIPARTGSYGLFCNGEASVTYAEYVLSDEIAGGKTITASVWSSVYDSGTSISATTYLKYKIGSGSFVTLDSRSSNSLTYGQLSGSFNNPGNDPVTIRIEAELGMSGGFLVAQPFFDDWAISGEIPD